MIECLKGTVINIEPETIVIDVHQVGYLVYCGNPYRYEEWLNETVTVYTYQHVREDAIRLYGFLYREERRLFEKLLQVSGIGPKGALAIVASEQPQLVVEAIENEDEKFLVKFPGVGKKTARQMILDLKGKVQELVPNLIQVPTNSTTLLPQHPSENGELEEAVEALKALGYVEREIKKVLPTLRKDELTTDQYIKLALKEMLNRA
ncbi:Holliday junction branch migration protein RuvA [Salipaludibacillus keqinensis]|uniref:Holliday junction branch migration complex subunit RuvA n=1 Tax=Salipaludibacillus keqinensis TaxID=2045207 RepID=A0A323TN28_9BACI|nr:Holliday junction branch migration protein RuvA [Salipaludibacillus keqinensis]PYZ94133.1 Holliday junction branch migration protein RuvA [Salipaludibacillus keqinensis]